MNVATNLPIRLLFGSVLSDRLAAMSWLELILWIGLASLTVALLVMMGTRWGQVRPVSKCVALSVFAHVLFVAYAYGTKLSFNAGFGRETIVRVTLTSDGDLEPLATFAERPPPVPDAPSELAAAPPPPPTTDPVETKLPPSLLTAAEPTRAAPPPELLSPPTEVPTESVAQTPPSAPSAVPAPEMVASIAREVATAVEPAPSIDTATPEIEIHEPPAVATEVVAVATPIAVSAPRRAVDDQPLPNVYRLRVAKNRLQLSLPFGATEESEAGVQRALEWLALSQSSDGRWDASDYGAGRETRTLGQDRLGAGADADTGITGLAMLAFLGAGETHAHGVHRETVQRGLEYLLRIQAADGNLAGPAKIFEKMYCHGIATLALGEAYALTGDGRLRSALERAVRFTISAQHPTQGGWRYQPGDRGDISQFGWQVMALRSAELGGLTIPPNTRDLAIRFLDSATQGPNRGLCSYQPRERPTATMTAEALTCRYFLNVPPTTAGANDATSFVLRELPARGQSNLYYWYYATLALFQDQGPAWQSWNAALQTQLLARQRREGRLAGSWDTDDVWGGYGGRIYTTAMGALCLEVYYRYLPIYQPPEIRHAEISDPSARRR